jgi:ketosteroid isomerase-like protein
MNMRIKEFFDQYEAANADFDVVKIASFYADVFMFAGPQGAQAVKKDDFLKVLPRRKEFLKSLGLVSSKVERVEASELDSQYVLARVLWKMRIAPSGRDPAESENSSSYVLRHSGDWFQIVFQVDHQDLAERVKALG